MGDDLRERRFDDLAFAVTAEPFIANLGLAGFPTGSAGKVFMMREKIMKRLLRRIAEQEKQEQQPRRKTSYDQIS